jgi:hypothetical protein
MEGGPWSFQGNLVIIMPYDGFIKPSFIDLSHIDIWIQIDNLSAG